MEVIEAVVKANIGMAASGTLLFVVPGHWNFTRTRERSKSQIADRTGPEVQFAEANRADRRRVG